jgi:hypothetical protein
VQALTGISGRYWYTAFIASAAVIVAVHSPARASDYGTTGLIDIPTARMRSDATLALTAGYDQRHRQFAITYQATPWLEATYRYTGFNEFFYWDRNYEVKLRLIEEDGFFLPSVAVGIRDMVGTGVFGSEYVVASKRFGNLDATVGMGWGRLAGKGQFDNPFGYISDRFQIRPGFSGEGGEIEVGNFFSGKKVSLFGGFSYEFVDLPIDFTAEYNPDQYVYDFNRGGNRASSPISAGITWHARDNMDIALTAQHGDELAIRVTSYFDGLAEPAKQQPRKVISSYYLPQDKFPSGYRKSRWFDRLVFDAERAGLLVLEANLSADQSQVELVIGNSDFQLWSDALSHHIALSDLHLPATVETLYFVVEESGHRVATIIVPRPSYGLGIDDQEMLVRSRMLYGRTLNDPNSKLPL